MRRVVPRGITTNANRRPPGVAHGPTSRLVAPSSFDGVWKCGNPQTGFPHSHNAQMSFELDSGEPLHRRGEALRRLKAVLPEREVEAARPNTRRRRARQN